MCKSVILVNMHLKFLVAPVLVKLLENWQIADLVQVDMIMHRGECCLFLWLYLKLSCTTQCSCWHLVSLKECILLSINMPQKNHIILFLQNKHLYFFLHSYKVTCKLTLKWYRLEDWWLIVTFSVILQYALWCMVCISSV